MPKVIVEVLGDVSSLEKGFSKASASAKGFGRDIDRVSRGALAASLSFRGLGRSVAFASTAFLGGAGFVYAIKSTISAAEESQRVLGQTANSVKRAGLSWRDYRGEIRRTLLAQSQLSGFDDERLSATFAKLLGQTKDVSEALKLNALAANIARGANTSLETAQKVVSRAYAGQARGAAIYGIELKKGATATQILTAYQVRYGHSALAFSHTAVGAQARLSVAIQNTQEVIATRYLPSIARLLNRGADWLNQSKNQKRISDDVNEAVKTLTATVQIAAKAWGTFATAVGDVKTAFDKLPKPAKHYSGLDLLHDIGKNFEVANPFGGGGSQGGGNLFAGNLFAATQFGPSRQESHPRKSGGGFTPPPAAPRAGISSLAQLNLGLANTPNNMALLQQKRAYDVTAIAFLQRRYAEGKVTNKKYTEQLAKLYSDRNQTEATISGIQQDAADKLKAAADKQAAAFKKLLEHARQQVKRYAEITKEREARIASFALPHNLQVAAARAGTTTTLADDKRVAQATKRFAELAIKAGRLHWQGLIDAYNTIAAQNAILANQVKTSHRAVVSSTRLTAGIAFGSAAARREQEARIAQFFAHGGQAVIENHVYLDGKKVTQSVTGHQERAGKHQVVQRRGPHAGSLRNAV